MEQSTSLSNWAHWAVLPGIQETASRFLSSPGQFSTWTGVLWSEKHMSLRPSLELQVPKLWEICSHRSGHHRLYEALKGDELLVYRVWGRALTLQQLSQKDSPWRAGPWVNHSLWTWKLYHGKTWPLPGARSLSNSSGRLPDHDCQRQCPSSDLKGAAQSQLQVRACPWLHPQAFRRKMCFLQKAWRKDEAPAEALLCRKIASKKRCIFSFPTVHLVPTQFIFTQNHIPVCQMCTAVCEQLLICLDHMPSACFFKLGWVGIWAVWKFHFETRNRASPGYTGVWVEHDDKPRLD